MVIRYATAVLGAMILAGSAAFLASAVDPERAGAATTTVKTCGGGTIKLKAKEERTFRLHNRARNNRGLRPLCVHPKLTRAARAHSAEMVKKDYFGHKSNSGEGVGARLKRFSYHWRIFGENCAGGSGTRGRPNPIFKRWMNSTPHRANILDRRFREVGVGTYTGNYKGTSGYTMYTVDFGSRR